uniref:Uncharacterized protein n=1 Tax=Rhizophora mucronata TaxID=61149 RepID=A0A2P2PR05_RHIMU
MRKPQIPNFSCYSSTA